MITKEQMIKAFDFIENAARDYHSNKKTTINIVRNYMISHNNINNFLIEKDLAYSEFKRNSRIETDFASALRSLHNEIQNFNN